MVMHARKCPKLNDGYYSRNEARPYENMDKYPSSKSRSYRNDRYYDDSPSPAQNSHHDDDDSPGERPSPRYSNKSSYMEKARGRLHDRGTSRSPGDKRSDYAGKTNNVYSHRNGPVRTSGDTPSRERDSRELEARASQSRLLAPTGRDGYNKNEARGDGPLRDDSGSGARDTIPIRDENVARDTLPIRDENVARDGNVLKRVQEARENHVIKEGSHGKKDVRAEVQKTALRVCGDWSEHTSSSGKTFYYNCRQNVSKWEKPKDWNDEACIIPEHVKKQYAAKSIDYRRHSSTTVAGHPPGARPTSQTAGGGASVDVRPRTGSISQNSHISNSTNSGRTPNAAGCPGNRPGGGGSTPSNRAGGNTPSNRAGGTTPSNRAGGTTPSNRGNRTPSSSSAFLTNSAQPCDVTSAGYNCHPVSERTRTSSDSSQNGAQAYQNGKCDDTGRLSASQDSRNEDMEISPNRTPTNRLMSPTTPGSATALLRQHSVTAGTSVAPSPSPGNGGGGSLPQLVSKLGDTATQNMNSQELTQQALQTLQKLQQALTRQAALQQSTVNSQSPPSGQSDTPSSRTSPGQRKRSTSEATNQSQVEDMDCGSSPRSDASFRSSRCSSPAPSPASSPGLPLGVCGLSSNQPSQTTDLTPSLANFYDEKLIEHIQGWPAEHLARQADHFMCEAHTVGSLHCTQVSADLKKARSLVRIAEIQSTLQEQRILFLIQQVKDLENTKGQNSFMPT